MGQKVLVTLADGFEEIEAVSIIDVLRRSGLEVTVAGVGKRDVTGSHGITIQTDTKLEDVKFSPDAVVLPGGMPGADNLKKSSALKKLLEDMNKSNKVIGAICAAPAVTLAAHGILRGRKATCYPGFENKFGSDTTFISDRVVRDKNIITSRGPGTAIEFALEIVSALVSKEKCEELSKAMLVK
jgi:4-methyl-5(b-hydroxyethyl)-thiazole monophosphate biosynthesis